MLICKSHHLLPIWAIILVTILSGCEQNLNLDHYKNQEIEKMLVVNSILNPDSVIAVSVTHPYFFSDTHISFDPISNLSVEVSTKNGEWETLAYDANSKLYISTRKPNAGEIINLKVGDTAQAVNSSDTIPNKVAIEDVTASIEGPISIYWNNDYRFSYRITFQDPPSEDNFYFLSIEDDSQSDDFSPMGQIDYTTDYVFQVLANTINQDVQGWQPDGTFGYPFSDKGISGERYTLTVTEVLQSPLVSLIERLPRKINLYSISKSYYEYIVSVLSMDYDESALKGNLLHLGLTEPTKIYSNITNGAGLMGSYNLSTIQVDLLQLTDGWASN